RDELAALDLRSGDVDVVVGRVRRREAQEARAVRQQLDRALDDPVVAARLGGGGRLVAIVARVAAVVLVAAAAAATAAPAAGALGLIVIAGSAGGDGLADLLTRLAVEDGVDEVLLAEAAEAVDPELVGEQVE